VHITEAGSRLAAHARRIENEFNLAESAVVDMQPARALRLGVISTYPMAQIADTIKAAKRSGESERLEIIPGNERELLQRLARGQVDVALTIVRHDSGRFTAEALFTEHYALAIPGGHPLANKETIAAEELSDNTMIVRRHCEVLAETSRHFTERGVRPFFAFRGTNDEQVLSLVQAGLGLTMMPACYAAKGVARPLLSGFNMKRAVGFLYAGHADHYQHAASPMLDALRTRYARAKH
jgi:DNA-binding transcriptional LysR family regulator